MNSWGQYVRTTAGRDTQEQIGALLGVHQATVARWLSGSRAPTSGFTVVAFARAYGRPPTEALVAAGMLTEEEAKQSQ